MTVLDRVRIGEKYSLRVPGNGISATGVQEIRRLLNRHGVHSLDKDIPEWAWDYRVGGKGEFVGVIAKRAAKWCFQKHNIKLPAEAVSQIGNIGNQHCDKAQSYFFDWTKKFDWKKGDFGDEGSCFLRSQDGDDEAPQKPDAVKCLEENGVWAMRFYTDDTFERGVGRMWVVDMDRWALCINGYWYADGDSQRNHGTEHTLKLARILSQWLEHQYYHQCRVIAQTRAVWINSGGTEGAGFAVGPQEITKDIFDVRLDWEDPFADECCECEKKLRRREIMKTAEGDIICNECLQAKYDVCCHCGGNYAKGTCKSWETENYCTHCYPQIIRKCNQCQKDNHRHHMVVIDSVEMCDACMATTCKQCDCCGNWHLTDKLKDFGTGKACKNCYTKRTIECCHCKARQKIPIYVAAKIMNNGDKRYYDGNGFYASKIERANQYNEVRMWSGEVFMEPRLEHESLCVACHEPLFAGPKESPKPEPKPKVAKVSMPIDCSNTTTGTAVTWQTLGNPYLGFDPATGQYFVVEGQ